MSIHPKDVRIGIAKFAPKVIVADRIERYGKAHIIIRLRDGALLGAKLNEYFTPVYTDAAQLLRALVKLGVITTTQIRIWKDQEKLRKRDSVLADDLRTISRVLSKYSIALTSKQMASFKKRKQEPTR